MAQNKQITEIDTVPFQGGENVTTEPALLSLGEYSSVQNMRQMRPGFKQRMGYIKKHSTADGTNSVMTMFQFSKGKRTERHFYAQMSDSDILEATDNPPAVTTGAFGTEVYSGSASPIPASWSVLNDLCIFSNGVDQHQICAGDENTIQKFIVFDSNTLPGDIPSQGYDYTEEVTSADTSTVAVLDSIGAINVTATGYGTCSGTTLTGVGTAFLTELDVGQPVALEGSYHLPTLDTSHVKATSSSGDPHVATDPTTVLTGAAGTSNSWMGGSAIHQRFNIDILSEKAINKIYYENYHSSGANTDKGVQNFTFWGSNTASDFASPSYEAGRIIPAYSATYVKSTTTGDTGHEAHVATDITKNLIGTATGTTWKITPKTAQRFHIDLGEAVVINKIYYENYHDSGTETDKGVKAFTFWGSNEASAFAELTYGTDTNWTQLTTDVVEFAEHTDSDVADPNYVAVTNTTAYRYYAFKFASNWGDADYAGLRRVELCADNSWVQLTCSASAFDQHSASDAVDPKYLTVTNSTPYRYYSFKFVDNYTATVGMGVRRLQLGISESNETRYIASISSNTSATVSSAFSGHATCSFITTCQDCILICCPVMPNKLTFTVSAPNGTAATSVVTYYSSTGWKQLTTTDNTVTTGATLAKTGTMTWTTPTDAIPKYMYSANGFWVKIIFSTAIDSEVELSEVTYGSTFVPMQDVWDGTLVDAIEGLFYDYSATTKTTNKFLPITGSLKVEGTTPEKYLVYGTSAIDISLMHNTSDLVYFNTPDPITGFYVDVGATPNTTAAVTIDEMQYLAPDGTWTTVGSYTDGTSGLKQSGFITFSRQSNIKPVTFNGSSYNSYWYRFGTGGGVCSDNITIGIQVIPYYDINNFGIGLCNAIWDNRAVYAFDKDPSWIVLSAPYSPQVLSSTESAMFPAGDGRGNKIVCMKPFYDALLIAQEEKGANGGCITLLQKSDTQGVVGDTTVISTRYGCMNSQCMEVVETVEGGHMAFILSREGILFTDGKVVNFVPHFDDVRCYFDPSDSSCIRTGYESKMYLKYDSAFHVLKIGLTTGSSATENNIFLVYDLKLGVFMSDTYANNFSCECDCDAASGNVPVVRLAGGQGNGFVYILNSGLNDIATAVDASTTIELNNKGKIIRDCEMIIRAKAQTVGDMTLTPYHNGLVQTALVRTLSLTPEYSTERLRRHRLSLNFKDENISVKLRHNTVSESFYLLDYGVNIEEYSEQ